MRKNHFQMLLSLWRHKMSWKSYKLSRWKRSNASREFVKVVTAKWSRQFYGGTRSGSIALQVGGGEWTDMFNQPPLSASRGATRGLKFFTLYYCCTNGCEELKWNSISTKRLCAQDEREREKSCEYLKSLRVCCEEEVGIKDWKWFEICTTTTSLCCRIDWRFMSAVDQWRKFPDLKRQRTRHDDFVVKNSRKISVLSFCSSRSISSSLDPLRWLISNANPTHSSISWGWGGSLRQEKKLLIPWRASRKFFQLFARVDDSVQMNGGRDGKNLNIFVSSGGEKFNFPQKDTEKVFPSHLVYWRPKNNICRLPLTLNHWHNPFAMAPSSSSSLSPRKFSISISPSCVRYGETRDKILWQFLPSSESHRDFSFFLPVFPPTLWLWLPLPKRSR